jgi:hypothetical protein
MSELKDFYDEVARVAYDLYEKGGRIHGHDMADWLKAEMIVKKRYEKETKQGSGAAKTQNKPKQVNK